MFCGRDGVFTVCRTCCFLLFWIWSPLVKWVRVWGLNLYLFSSSRLPQPTPVYSASIWAWHSLPLSHRRPNVRTLRSSLSIEVRSYNLGCYFCIHALQIEVSLRIGLSNTNELLVKPAIIFSYNFFEGSNFCFAHFNLLSSWKLFQWIQHWPPRY